MVRQKRSQIKNLGNYAKKEELSNAQKIVEFAETAKWGELENMPESDIDFSKPKNVLDQYRLLEQKSYTILRLPKNKMPVLSQEDLKIAKHKYENHPDRTGIFTDTDCEIFVAKKGIILDKTQTYIDGHPFKLFEASTGFDASGKNTLPDGEIWLPDSTEDTLKRKFYSASNKEKFPTRDDWPMKNSDEHADRIMITQKDSAIETSSNQLTRTLRLLLRL